MKKRIVVLSMAIMMVAASAACWCASGPYGFQRRPYVPDQL